MYIEKLNKEQLERLHHYLMDCDCKLLNRNYVASRVPDEVELTFLESNKKNTYVYTDYDLPTCDGHTVNYIDYNISRPVYISDFYSFMFSVFGEEYFRALLSHLKINSIDVDTFISIAHNDKSVIDVQTKADVYHAQKSSDPDNPGIYIELTPIGQNYPIDLTLIENPENTKDTNVYIWSDPHSEDWQYHCRLHDRDIQSAMDSFQ